jgi:hypothetical protein
MEMENMSNVSTATKVVATSQAGYSTNQVDYLCNGSNDAAQINAAIAALPSTGGRVVLLEGTYNITATLNLSKDNMTFEGMGKKSTILKVMDDNLACLLYITGNRMAIQNICFAGKESHPCVGILRIITMCWDWVVRNWGRSGRENDRL